VSERLDTNGRDATETDDDENCAALFMAALCNRADHYISALWFLSSIFLSSPHLSGRRLDVYHTSTHGVALVQI